MSLPIKLIKTWFSNKKWWSL